MAKLMSACDTSRSRATTRAWKTAVLHGKPLVAASGPSQLDHDVLTQKRNCFAIFLRFHSNYIGSLKYDSVNICHR